jgi:nicotinamide phosphoribosyltransferase
MKNLIVPTLADFYKISHRSMYPTGTETVYSTWTPRTSRIKGVDNIVCFGTQAFIKEYLIDIFNTNFFNRPKEEVIGEYKRLISATLGDPNPETKHLEELHDLGYLPLSIKALPEGTIVPTRVPVMTIQNTDKRFFWLTNFIETLASCELWQPATSATLAIEYKKMMDKYAQETNPEGAAFTIFQGHDFSMRGMSSLRSAILSGMGHLLSFAGTDTIPAISAAEYYYNADVTKELIGTSVPATEHSIQCTYGDDTAYLKRMLSEVHPSGIVSIVSDGYDFWDVVTRVVPSLKKEIMARSGGPVGDKVVIRPDSGDPVLIVCGDPEAPKGSPEYKGAVECLYETFGGTLTSIGYKVLDSHIGLIYGDAITLPRAKEIMQRLKDKGFASTNVVFGIGSYTYQYNTRDTFGFALKSTLCVIDGVEKQIFKDPKTDNGIKKSQKGRVVVLREGNTYIFRDGLSLNDVVSGDQLKEVFCDGKLLIDENFSTIRERIQTHIK